MLARWACESHISPREKIHVTFDGRIWCNALAGHHQKELGKLVMRLLVEDAAEAKGALSQVDDIPRLIRPPLKWAGGKRWLVPHLKKIWQDYSERRLVEPLCGGLAVTLGMMPKEALVNDINPHAINFYKWLKKGLGLTIQLENCEEVYYRHRERFNELIGSGKSNSKEAASLFYYLNRTGYNGLCRFNRQGEFNVPFGRYKSINYVRDFYLYQSIFSDWDFSTGDFETVELEHSDFVYADPPYDVEFTQYSKEGFNWEDQERLADWLARHKGPVVLSNQATKRIVALYKKLGFKVHFLNAPRKISCTGDRTPAKEVIAIKGI